MSSQPVRATSGRVLRHWTINNQAFVGGSQRAAPTLPYSESVNIARSEQLAVKLAGVKADLARRAR